MKKNLDLVFLSVALAVILVSCNLYSPLTSTGSDEARIEEALKCLHDGDYQCAIENYSALSDPKEKARRLCQTNLARAGLTLSLLIQTLGDSQSTSDPALLGVIANKLIPWDATKQTAAEEAKKNCTQYKTEAVAGTTEEQEFGDVLNTLGAFIDCTTRMAKVDQLVSADNTDDCTTPGNKDGKVTANEITADTVAGSISAGQPGMCKADVEACLADFSAVNSSGDAELKNALDQLPPELKNSGTATDLARKAVRDTVGG